jgi:nicotinamidase-related amidase
VEWPLSDSQHVYATTASWLKLGRKRFTQLATPAEETWPSNSPSRPNLGARPATSSSPARERVYGTPLTAHLTKLGVRTVIVCGESTSGRVRASAVDAYSSRR